MCFSQCDSVTEGSTSGTSNWAGISSAASPCSAVLGVDETSSLGRKTSDFNLDVAETYTTWACSFLACLCPSCPGCRFVDFLSQVEGYSLQHPSHYHDVSLIRTVMTGMRVGLAQMISFSKRRW